MKENEFKEQLVRRYINNQATAEELEAYFRLLKSGELDEILAKYMTEEAAAYAEVEKVAIPPLRIPKETKVRKIPRWVSVAATLTILLVMSYLYRTELLNLVDPIHMQQMVTEHGERTNLQLLDGTEVWLSPGSSLEYPDKFRGEFREVMLKGEAFFEVATDAQHPFIVRSGAINTIVFGTSFNVTAYEDEQDVTVTLLEGLVALEVKDSGRKDSSYLDLVPHQKAIFSKQTGTLSKKFAPEAQEYLNKRDGLFRYDGTLVSTIALDLKRQFGVSIKVNERLNNLQFKGILDSNKDLSEFLDKLCTVINARWEKSGTETYKINPN